MKKKTPTDLCPIYGHQKSVRARWSFLLLVFSATMWCAWGPATVVSAQVEDETLDEELAEPPPLPVSQVGRLATEEGSVTVPSTH